MLPATKRCELNKMKARSIRCNPTLLRQMLSDRTTKELEQMQTRKNKLQQEFEQLSSTKERLSVDNQQIANELKVRDAVRVRQSLTC